MFWPIERRLPKNRSARSERATAWRLASAGARRLALACALLGVGGCADGGERVVATIYKEAGPAEGGGEKCVPLPYEAADMGLDLYFVLERSGDNAFQGDPTWNVVVSALGALFNATSEFNGMGVGFIVHPQRVPARQSCVDDCGPLPRCDCLWNDCDCWSAEQDPQQGSCSCRAWPTSCEPADYVPSFGVTRLRDNPEGFFSKLLETNSSVVTRFDEAAMYPALVASLRDRKDWESRNPGRRVTQVLVSTSLNSDCEDRISALERLLNGPDTPKTYVVRADPDPNPDDDNEYASLAAAGRTAPAISINVRVWPPPPPSMSATESLRDLVQKIRANDGRCEYLLPDPLPSDFNDKKVNLTASSGGLLYPKVANREACERDHMGWFYDDYDDANHPRRIVACEGACRSLHGPDAGPTSGMARIQLGCPTVMTADAGL